jgi:hypothetical protein
MGRIVKHGNLIGLCGALALACGGGDAPAEPEPETRAAAAAPSTEAPSAPTPAPEPSGPPGTPPSLPNGLLLAYSQFQVENGQVTANPGAARFELLTRRGGEWTVDSVEDDSSNVFHKAFWFDPPGDAAPGVVTLGAMGAAVKLWRRSGDAWSSETLWEASFGGTFDRMRDAEVADLFGDAQPAIAVATHDQGVVAVLRSGDDGWTATELAREPNTFIHEIEIGDLDGDGTPEVYATPSEPNELGGGEQRGQVVRFVPRTGEGPTVVADLGNRHAKEIWVGDADGDGTDELYVAVEALTRGRDPNVEIVEPVEIRRYDADTPADGRVVIATIRDRLCRFLTVGDVDGDGRPEMVAAAFRSGLWMLRPGRDPRGEWSRSSIDRQSSGFEHASIFADLDGDGRDELYVASDEQGEVRRYTWRPGVSRPDREVIHTRPLARSRITWNIMPFPVP